MAAVADDSVLVALIKESMVADTPGRRKASRILLDLLQRRGDLGGLASELHEAPKVVKEQVTWLVQHYQLSD